MKKIISTILSIGILLGSVTTSFAAEIWWSHPTTYQGVDSSLSEKLKIQTPDGRLQAYCIFNFNTGTIEYFDPIYDKSNPFAFYIPASINNVKVTGINDQALCGIFYDQSPMWESYMGYTEVYVPSSITEFGDMSFYSGYITEDGYTICCEENSAAYKAAQGEKIKVCSVEEKSMFSAIDWNEYAELMNDLTAGTSVPQRTINVVLDGEYLYFDQNPIIEDGRTLVPMRAIFEALGATVNWEQSTQTITSKKDNITIILQIGSNIMKKNTEDIILDVPAKIYNDYTMVPARAVAEAFGCNVGWDGDTRTVTITE